MSSAWSSRPGLAWVEVRDSLWLLPSIAVVVGTGLAMVAVQVPTPRPESRFAWVWLFGGGAEGARGVLSAIAGSLITVTATVFSVTIVALQLASSQFTPRLLRSFVADRVNQTVLAVFIGTFTYTLLVLRTIHSTASGEELFVPQVGVTLALVLLLVSIGALVMFINHAAQSIRASVILHRETRRTLAQIAELFPADIGEPAPPADAEAGIDGPPGLVRATESGYLQAVHAGGIWSAPRQPGTGPVTIRMELHVGAFAFAGKPLASVWPRAAAERLADAIRDAFVLGPERTPEQDVEYGIVELSDIAVRALSPAINDPTTAMQGIDRLTQILAAIGSRHRPATVRESPDGQVRLHVRDTPFERVVGLAFDQVRHYGVGNPSIAKKLLESLSDLTEALPAECHRPLVDQMEAVLAAARLSVENSADLAGVERLGTTMRAGPGAIRHDARHR